MDDDVKVCPECKAEYFPHVTECKSCETALVYPRELDKIKPPKAQGRLICVEEGDFEKIKGLSYELGRRGIECDMLNIAQGNTCSTAGEFGIFVPQTQVQSAISAIEEIMHKLYPELSESEARLNKGLCPACGADISANPGECPDCGLNLSGGSTGDCGGYGTCE